MNDTRSLLRRDPEIHPLPNEPTIYRFAFLMPKFFTRISAQTNFVSLNHGSFIAVKKKCMIPIIDKCGRFILTVYSCFLFSSLEAQRANDLLVYAVKGTVTATYNNQETPIKIGKVLRNGTTLHLRQGARLTMVCKEGKPLAVDREGVFPLSKWKDSCRSGANSITSNYFKYIWSEMYARSPEHSEEEKGVNAVTRSPAPDIFNPGRIRIEFNRGLDTLNYAGGDFPLSWTCYDYNGKYVFKLYDAKSGKLIYKDSLTRSLIRVSKFNHLLVPGKRYSWSISTPRTGVSKRRILNYIPAIAFEKYMTGLQEPVGIPEETSARQFRIGFMLEQRHYLAEAYTWYKKAVETDPAMELYRDKLLRFKNEFWISD
jgi:hypothetical protein